MDEFEALDDCLDLNLLKHFDELKEENAAMERVGQQTAEMEGAPSLDAAFGGEDALLQVLELELLEQVLMEQDEENK